MKTQGENINRQTKRNIVFAFAIAVLLASGAISGLVYNNKEKKEVETKHALIVNAEKKLEAKEKERRDTLSLYKRQLNVLQHKQDSLRSIIKIDRINFIFNKMVALSHIENDKKVLKGRLQVPSIRRYTLNTVDKDGEVWVRNDLKSFFTNDLSVYFYYMRIAFNTTEVEDWYQVDKDVRFYRDVSLNFYFHLLKSIEIFLNNIDNSDGAFDKEDLQELRSLVKESLPVVKQGGNIEHQTQKVQNKIMSIKQGKTALDRKIKQQQNNLIKYNSSANIKIKG